VTQILLEHTDDLIHRIMATPEGHADPYALYRRLREQAPVHRSALDGNWYVSGFETCRQVLGDPRVGKSEQFVVPRHGVDPERVRIAQRRRRTSMLTANPPEHTRLRGAAKGAFIPPTMASLQPRVAAIIDERPTASPPSARPT
jgi:cytochrome P450